MTRLGGILTSLPACSRERLLILKCSFDAGCYQVPLATPIARGDNQIRDSFTEDKRQRGKLPLGPSDPPARVQGVLRSNCPIIHTCVERGSVFPHRMAECALNPKGTTGRSASLGFRGGLHLRFPQHTPPTLRGRYGGLPARWNWGSGLVAGRRRRRRPRRLLVSPFGGGKIPISGHRRLLPLLLGARFIKQVLPRALPCYLHPTLDVVGRFTMHDITSNGPHPHPHPHNPPDLPVPVPDPICRKPVESRMGCEDSRHWLHRWSPVSTVPLDSFSTPPLPRDDDGSIAGLHLINLHLLPFSLLTDLSFLPILWRPELPRPLSVHGRNRQSGISGFLGCSPTLWRR